MAYIDKRGRKRETYRDPKTKKVKTRYLEKDNYKEKPAKTIPDETISQLKDTLSRFIECIQDKSNNKDLVNIIIELTNHHIENSLETLTANPLYTENKRAIELINRYIKIIQEYKNSLNKNEPIDDINQEIENLEQLKEKWSKIKVSAVGVFKEDLIIINR